MTKVLSLATLAVMAAAMQAQTAASPQTPDTAAQATQQTSAQAQPQVQPASVSAELTKGIDTKKVKPGDEVNAKTTDPAKLPDGTDLPKGTKLVGNVVEVNPKTKEQKNSHLVLALNRAVLKDGKEVPIRAAVTSVTAPGSTTPMMDMAAGGGAMGGAPSGGAPSGSSGSASSAPSAPSVQPMPSGDSGGQTPQQGAMLKSAQDRVPVGNKPNVMLSAPTTPESAGVLDGAGENISLDSGTKLTLNVIPARPGSATK